MRIFYGVSPIGLGHATRSVAVGEELLASGAEILFATDGPAADLLKESGFRVESVVREPVPEVKDGEMKNAFLWYLNYWRAFRSSKSAIAPLMRSFTPSVVVGDEEFASVSLALEMRVPHAMIADELELDFARTWLASQVERRVSEWYSELQHKVMMLIIPEGGSDGGNRRYVGPVVRRATRTRSRIFEDLGLPANARVVVLAMSGTGFGSHLIEGALKSLSLIPDSFLVIVGNRGTKVKRDRVFDLGPVGDGQNYVAAADVAVSTAGKSTIDEAESFGTPMVAIPIRNHSEQVKNASALGFTPDDLGRLPELIASSLGKRGETRTFAGAQRAANLISSLATS